MKGKIFNNLTDREKYIFINEHFHYEVDMFFFALRKNTEFIKAANFEEKQFHSNMAIEDFLLHARNLLEFFYYNNDKKKQHASAGDFFTDKDHWIKIIPRKTKSIIQLEKRVNSEVTHLSYDRVGASLEDKKWNNVTLLHDFMALVKIFLINIDGKYLSKNLKEEYQ